MQIEYIKENGVTIAVVTGEEKASSFVSTKKKSPPLLDWQIKSFSGLPAYQRRGWI
mgnify:CR=1 FL=1